MRAFRDDLVDAVRSLTRSRGYALSVMLILALGIGANTAIFSLVDVVLFRELPVDRPHELARAFRIGSDGEIHSFSYPAYKDVRDQ